MKENTHTLRGTMRLPFLAKIPRLSFFTRTIRLLNPWKTTEIKAGTSIHEGLDSFRRDYRLSRAVSFFLSKR